MSTLKTNNIQHVDLADPSILLNSDGSVSIAGTVSYEDATNVDSVGIITGRLLVNAQKQVHVGTGVSVKAGGLNVTAGITTVQALQATTGTFSGTSTFSGAVNISELTTFSKSGSAVRLNDSSILRLGNDDSDFFLYHDGNTIDYISAGASRQLRLTTDDFIIKGSSNTETLMTAAKDGNVVLYHDNTGRLNTNSTGITVTNRITGGGDANTYINVGPNDIIDLYTGGTNVVRLDASGRLLIGHTSSQQSTSMLQVSRANNSTIRVANSDATATNYAGIDFAPANSIAGASIRAVAVGTFGSTGAETAFLKFDTRNAGTTTEQMRIDSSGRLLLRTAIEGHADSDDLTIANGSDSGNRAGITIRSAEYGNIFFSDATSGTAEYQGVIQYYHTDDIFQIQLGGAQKVTIGANNIALFGTDNLSSRGVNYYGVDLAYKGSGIQGRSDNPTIDICSNVYHDGSSAYKYGEGNTTAGQLSVGGNQVIFSSAGSGTAGATATLTEKFRFNLNNTMIFGSTTSNISNGIHLANGMMRFQAANQNSSDFSQQVGIEWSQESGSDVQVGKIVMRRDAWGGAPHNMDFWTRTYSNQVTRNMTIAHDGGIFFQNLLGNASSGSAVKYSNSDDELRYDTSSKLLKTNIAELTKYGIDTVKNLKPCTFTPQEYDKDGTITVGSETLIGFIADEMVTEVPEVVQMYPKSSLTKQEEDTEIVPAAISYDKLTVVLTKALQEAIAEIETLKAKVAALEGS